MKPTAALLLLTACVVAESRLPKALWQLAETVMCAQPGINPFLYNEYGCWCGIGGGGITVDEVDECCKVHDECYRASRLTPGCTAIGDLPYILVYDFTCSDRRVTCSATNDRCQAAVCECDRVAAHCFAQSPYHPEHKNLDRDVLCGI